MLHTLFPKRFEDSSNRILLIIITLFVWGILLFTLPSPLTFLVEYGYFFLVGISGAIVANATGAGGGIIFIPFFSAYGLSESQSLATSILIQCFGMTVGSLSWLSSKSSIAPSAIQFYLMSRILVLGGFSTSFGVLAAQYFLTGYDIPMTQIFRLFSIIFGLVLLYVSLNAHGKSFTRYHLSFYDILLICISCLIGGITTAWLSIGVGEFIALALILRGFPTMIAIASGVCMSSIAVLTALPLHYIENVNIDWNIILITAPAAIIGATVARLLVLKLGGDKLKIFLAIWIFMTGLIM